MIPDHTSRIGNVLLGYLPYHTATSAAFVRDRIARPNITPRAESGYEDREMNP